MTWKREEDTISYSALKTYNDCPWLYKKKYIDMVIPFVDSVFTLFGKAVHTVCQEMLCGNEINFLGEFQWLLKDKLSREEILEKADLIKEMFQQGQEICNEFAEYMKETFGNFEVIFPELYLKEPISGSSMKFKGYVDLVLKLEDGKYGIIDLKTATWGWNAKQKNNTMAGYQIIYYKNFFAQQYGIDLKDVETYFVLLKRTAKVGKKIEAVKITSGNVKVNNALKLLVKTIRNIHDTKVFFKRRTSCEKCWDKKYCKKV